MPGPSRNMDDVFEELFGFRPKKRGTGYELLVAAALKIAQRKAAGKLPPAAVKADQFVRGDLSQTVYQLDALIETEETTAVEAKDYTEKAKPVGRPDVQKLAGALLDLSIDRGVVASATGFTRPAKKFASAMESAEDRKTIELVAVRPSVEGDEVGRIRRVITKVRLRSLGFDDGTWTTTFPKEVADALPTDGSKLSLETIYRRDGTVLETMNDFGRTLTSELDWTTTTFEGERSFPADDAFVRVGDRLLPIKTIAYSIPVYVSEFDIVVERQGTPRLLFRFESGLIDTLITDAELKAVRFLEDGTVTLDDDGGEEPHGA